MGDGLAVGRAACLRRVERLTVVAERSVVVAGTAVQGAEHDENAYLCGVVAGRAGLLEVGGQELVRGGPVVTKELQELCGEAAGRRCGRVLRRC